MSAFYFELTFNRGYSIIIMLAYAIQYKVNGQTYDKLIDAKDIKSAKKKLGKKHGYADGRKIQIDRVIICGYY